MKKIKNNRGIVLMAVLTIIVFLVAIVQQMSFNTSVEFHNGVSSYHQLKAYHAAKSGAQIALLKVLMYKKIISLMKIKNPTYVQLISNLLWRQPTLWPPYIPFDSSQMKKDEVKQLQEDSFWNHTTYEVWAENEESKLSLNDLASSHGEIRSWTRSTLTQLLMLLRKKEKWIEDRYSENEIHEWIEEVEKHLNPNTQFTKDSLPLNRPFLSIDELLIAKPSQPEWIELLRPYVSVFHQGGLYLQFAKKLLIQSLSEGITDLQVDNLFYRLNPVEEGEEQVTLSSTEQIQNFFQTEGIELENAFLYSSSEPTKKQNSVFHFNPPQIFQIRAKGVSGDTHRHLSFIIYDPMHIMRRTYQLMHDRKKDLSYPIPPPADTSLPAEISISTSPLIIEWKEIN